MKRVAVVTGASSGIGKAIAQYYIKEGYLTITIDRTEKHPPDAAVEEHLQCDLKDQDAIYTMIFAIYEAYPSIDVLVNNAGILELDDFNNPWWSTMQINFAAPIILCRELFELLRKGRGGHIINIGSVAGIQGDTEAPIYSACKAGAINLTRSLAKKFAPNIRVNCISPGLFDTNLVLGLTPKELIDQVPMCREAQPFEIIPVVDMLQKSPYMTGANIVIDGGLSL